MNKNTILALAMIISALLAGCHDGRQFNARAAEELKQVEYILDTWETRDGKHYKGIGGALLHEMQYRSASFREDKFYPVGDHYSVNVQSSAQGLVFSVARDH